MKKNLRKLFRSQETNPNLWVTTYGDMMTTLMIFFLMLWAFSEYVKDEKAKPVLIRASPQQEALRDQVKKDMEGFGTVILTRRKMTITLPSAVLFDSGRADLKAAASDSLSKVFEMLQKSTAPVVVEGHTDDIPIQRSQWRSNYELSAARAFSVIQFLTSHGVTPQRLAARGYGPHRPLAPNDSDENRMKNRRIEIHLWTS